MVLQAEWPKRKSILGRGLLALTLKTGAEDLADGARATVASITSKDHPREYHHLFPASTLEDAEVPDEQVYRAPNCALITWRTNRTISNKDPIAYLKERADNSALGEPSYIAGSGRIGFLTVHLRLVTRAYPTRNGELG